MRRKTVTKRKINLGYTVTEKVRSVTPEKAREILLSGKKNKITRASRKGDRVCLTSHVWTCPYCGARFPAYAKYFVNDNEDVVFDDECAGINFKVLFGSRPTKAQIDDLTSTQIPMFGKTDSEPCVFNGECRKIFPVVCPNCAKQSSPSGKYSTIEFIEEKDKLSVTTPLSRRSDLFGIGWMLHGKTVIGKNVTETVTFNFRRGKVSLSLGCEEYREFSVCDVTNIPEAWKDGPLAELFDKFPIVRKIVRRMFEKVSRAKIPFTNEELTPERLVLMTRFIGYSKDFYSSIPFSGGSGKICGSFSGLMKSLHRESDARKLFEESPLPNIDSVRREFRQRPGLIFYIREIEKLWSVVKDENLLVKILSYSSVFEILSEFHEYPMLFPYYRDFAEVKGPISMVMNLTDYTSSFNKEAAYYSIANDGVRAAMRKAWKHDGAIEQFDLSRDEDDDYGLKNYAGYSVPMAKAASGPEACTILGYRFDWLTSWHDYISVGKALRNCLPYWKSYRNPVVAVYEKGVPVAAIEVGGTKVIQAFSADNNPISGNENLYYAYRTFLNKFGLTESADGHFDRIG